MSKIDQLIAELCPDGVEWKTLGEVIENNIGGGTPSKTNPQYWNGNIPWASVKDLVREGMFLNNTLDDITTEGLKNSPSNLIPQGWLIVCTRINPGLCSIAGKDIAINQDLRALSFHKLVIVKYIWYYFKTLNIVGKGTTVKGISVNELERIPIPIPPLPIQEEIVRILDTFTTLEAELEAGKKQYAYYRDSLLTFGDEVEWKTLGDIGKVSMCKRILKEQTQTVGDIPFYKIGTFGKEPDAYIPKELFCEYKEKYSYPNKGDILISAAGTIGRTVIFDGTPSYFQDSNIVWIANDETKILNRYLFHFYKIAKWAVADGGTIARLYNDIIRKTPIPIPPLAEQERIVAILDRFETLTNDISRGLPAEIGARRKQYEHYRDQLLTFPAYRQAEEVTG